MRWVTNRVWVGVAAVTLGLMGVGCGPVQYVSTVGVTASRVVEEAETINARLLAPYEYWSAVTYLRMAREKAGTADFETSVDYGDRAIAMARAALRVVAARRQQPAKGGVAPDPAPAGKDDEKAPAVEVMPIAPAGSSK